MSLFPPIEPYHRQYLDVGDDHLLYVEQSGNPDGEPVVALHGGPGGGSSPLLRRMLMLAPAALIGGYLGARLPGDTPWVGTLALILALFLVFAHIDDLVRRALAGFIPGQKT